MNAETVRRFWSKVQQGQGCWLWTASKRNKGYGAFVWADENGRVVQGRAHRFSWLLHFGSIEPGTCVLHRCDIPACVRPDHLFLGTKADNNADMNAKGRRVRGGTRLREQGRAGKYRRAEAHHNSKTTWSAVEIIRREHGEGMSLSQCAKRHGLSVTAIHKIVHHKTWRKDA